MSSELLCGVYYENHTQTVFLYQDKTGWTVPSDHLFFVPSWDKTGGHCNKLEYLEISL